jgi:hypothetical protein
VWAPKECGKGKAKLFIYYPDCELKPKPLELTLEIE